MIKNISMEVRPHDKGFTCTVSAPAPTAEEVLRFIQRTAQLSQRAFLKTSMGDVEIIATDLVPKHAPGVPVATAAGVLTWV